MAKVKPEFDKRGVKMIGLSVDPVDRHAARPADIEETQGHAPNYPMIRATTAVEDKLARLVVENGGPILDPDHTRIRINGPS